MSITATYPAPSHSQPQPQPQPQPQSQPQPPQNGDIKTETPATTNAFTQWPDGKAETVPIQDAASATTNSLSRLQETSQPRASSQSITPNPLIDAYMAADVDTTYINGRLEDDDALMVRLATASDLYAYTPTADTLTPAQRKQLMARFVQACTQGIDWQTALGPDPDRPDAVYYDGLTLRNAGSKSLTKVTEEIEARIDKVLRKRGIAEMPLRIRDALATGNDETTRTADIARLRDLVNGTGLARQVRRTMLSDPTLSLQPPPDAVYGSPRWITLWTGMQTLAAMGFDPGKRDADTLIAIGRATISARAATDATTSDATTPNAATPNAAIPNTAASNTTTSSTATSDTAISNAATPDSTIPGGAAQEAAAARGIDMGGLLLMAHAAGKLDLRAVAKGETTISGEQLTAYYKELFADDLRLLDTLVDLARVPPPSGKQLAIDNLRAAGIDPDFQIDVDSLIIPSPFGSARWTISLPVTLKKQSICDFYLSRQKLPLEMPSTSAQPQADSTGSADSTVVPANIAQARAKLANSLKDEFDAAFDQYAASVSRHVAEFIDISISRYGKQHGIDVSNASITVSTVQRRISFGKIGLGRHADIEFTPKTITEEEKDGEGYFISLDTPDGKHTYFLPLASGIEVPLPPNIAIDDWAKEHGQLVFGTDRETPPPDGKLVRRIVEAVLDHAYPVKTLASGKRENIADRIKAAVPETLERFRAGAYGSSIVEILQSIERSFIPFYGTYSAIREGRTDDITLSVQLDVLMFMPTLGETASLGMRAGEALAAGVARAAASYAADSSLWRAVKVGVVTTGSHLPALGWQAGKVLWSVVRSVIITPKDILEMLHGIKWLTTEGMRAIIRRLKVFRPKVAEELSAALVHWIPNDIVQRYQVSDPALLEMLANAMRSENGTIMLGAHYYAEINGYYVRLVADHATSTSDMQFWRIHGMPLPGTGDGGLLIYWNKELRIWCKADATPKVLGGGAGPSTEHAADAQPMIRVTRKIDDDAVAGIKDRLVATDTATSTGISLAKTETVQSVEQILRQAADLTHYPWWDTEFDQIFNVRVGSLKDSVYLKLDPSLADPANANRMKATIENNMRTFLKELYVRSETFRALVNHAKATGRLRKGFRRIVIDIILPKSIVNGEAILIRQPEFTYWGKSTFMTVHVPDIQSPPLNISAENSPFRLPVFQPHGEGETYIPYEGGVHGQFLSTPGTIIHEMVHLLTGMHDPTKNIDRGAVEYLAQRVQKECGIPGPRRLTYPRLGANWSQSELEVVGKYVNVQDKYLSKLFPLPPLPATPWNPSAGNEHLLTANTAS